MAGIKGRKWRGKQMQKLAVKPVYKNRLLCSSSLQGPSQQMCFENSQQIRLHRRARAVTSSQFPAGFKIKLEAVLLWLVSLWMPRSKSFPFPFSPELCSSSATGRGTWGSRNEILLFDSWLSSLPNYYCKCGRQVVFIICSLSFELSIQIVKKKNYTLRC